MPVGTRGPGRVLGPPTSGAALKSVQRCSDLRALASLDTGQVHFQMLPLPGSGSPHQA